MIIQVTRGSILLAIGERTVTVYGEVLLPDKKDEPSFVVFSKSFTNWDKPFENKVISEKEKNDILQIIIDEMRKEKGMIVEVD